MSNHPTNVFFNIRTQDVEDVDVPGCRKKMETGGKNGGENRPRFHTHTIQGIHRFGDSPIAREVEFL